MKKPHTLLRWSLFGGAIYFFFVAAAHLFGLKIPILFIYFNVPSYIYQDIVISFLAFGWGMFLLAGYSSVKSNELITTRYIIIAGFAAVIGLIGINSLADFEIFENEFQLVIKKSYFWGESLLLLAYVVWLLLLYMFAGKVKLTEPVPKPKSINELTHEEQQKYTQFR